MLLENRLRRLYHSHLSFCEDQFSSQTVLCNGILSLEGLSNQMCFSAPQINPSRRVLNTKLCVSFYHFSLVGFVDEVVVFHIHAVPHVGGVVLEYERQKYLHCSFWKMLAEIVMKVQHHNQADNHPPGLGENQERHWKERQQHHLCSA